MLCLAVVVKLKSSSSEFTDLISLTRLPTKARQTAMLCRQPKLEACYGPRSAGGRLHIIHRPITAFAGDERISDPVIIVEACMDTFSAAVYL